MNIIVISSPLTHYKIKQIKTHFCSFNITDKFHLVILGNFLTIDTDLGKSLIQELMQFALDRIVKITVVMGEAEERIAKTPKDVLNFLRSLSFKRYESDSSITSVASDTGWINTYCKKIESGKVIFNIPVIFRESLTSIVEEIEYRKKNTIFDKKVEIELVKGLIIETARHPVCLVATMETMKAYAKAVEKQQGKFLIVTSLPSTKISLLLPSFCNHPETVIRNPVTSYCFSSISNENFPMTPCSLYGIGDNLSVYLNRDSRGSSIIVIPSIEEAEGCDILLMTGVEVIKPL
jgi:hypothetical protein